MLPRRCATLAKPSRRDNRDGRRLPWLLLMTDVHRLPDPAAAVARLPAGAAVVVRHPDAGERARLAGRLQRLCRRRGLRLVIADDPRLARRLGADGLHLPEARLRSPRRFDVRPGTWITAAAHAPAAMERARLRGVDAVLLSPVAPTASHPGRPPLGRRGFRRLAGRRGPAVYALGGVGPQDAQWVRLAGGAGIAGIGALAEATAAALRRAGSAFFRRGNWCRTRCNRTGPPG